MLDLSILRNEVVIVFLLIVFTFNQISSFSKQTLLSILVIAIVSWFAYQYLTKKLDKVNQKDQDDNTFFDKEGALRKETASNRVDVATFPRKGFRFLKQNRTFMEVAKLVVLCRMFDRASFSDMLLYMDRCQKVYMYILDGRYSPTSHVPHFLDMRESVLTSLYGMYFSIPEHLKHVYGVAPYDNLSKAIDTFISVTEEMLEVLRSYTHKTAKIPYFPQYGPSASDAPFDAMNSRVLP